MALRPRDAALVITVIASVFVLILFVYYSIRRDRGYAPLPDTWLLYIDHSSLSVMKLRLDGVSAPVAIGNGAAPNKASRVILLPDVLNASMVEDGVVNIDRDQINGKWSVWVSTSPSGELRLIARSACAMGSAFDIWQYASSSFRVEVGDRSVVEQLKHFPQILLDQSPWAWAVSDHGLGFQSLGGSDNGDVYTIGDASIFGQIRSAVRVAPAAIVAELADDRIVLLDGLRRSVSVVGRGYGIAAAREME